MIAVHSFAISSKIQRLLEDSKKPLYVVRLSVVTHEPDPPNSAGRSAESAGNLNTVLAHHVRRHRLPVHIGRNENARHRWKAELWVLRRGQT